MGQEGEFRFTGIAIEAAAEDPCAVTKEHIYWMIPARSDSIAVNKLKVTKQRCGAAAVLVGRDRSQAVDDRWGDEHGPPSRRGRGHPEPLPAHDSPYLRPQPAAQRRFGEQVDADLRVGHPHDGGPLRRHRRHHPCPRRTQTPRHQRPLTFRRLGEVGGLSSEYPGWTPASRARTAGPSRTLLSVRMVAGRRM